MTFIEMRDLLIKHFDEKMRNKTHLFEVHVDKDAMWDLYLKSFPAGSNDIFRKRTEHDCSCCRGFIKHIGNVIAIENGIVTSIWDFSIDDPVYTPVVKALSEFIHKAYVDNVYLSSESKVGCHHNFELMESVGQHRWDHFFIDLGTSHVIKAADKNTVIGEYRTAKDVFKRSLEEISLDAVDTVLELIAANSIYRGEEWQKTITEFRTYKIAYNNLTDDTAKDLFAWEKSAEIAKTPIVRIKNCSIGTLLTDITNGRDLEEAVRHYEAITDPTVYKRPRPIFTEKMRQEAEKKMIDLGFMPSLARRFATLDDITVNDILFTNKDAAKRIKGAESIFDELAKDVKTSPKKFDRVESMSFDKFINDILPTASSLEAYVENKHTRNFVSLIAPVNTDAKPMFKWGTNFGWAYTGNATDSFKDKVKEFGGDVTGVLRFSIKWNESQDDSCDLDAHAIEPNGFEIQYSSKTDFETKGFLDVDIINPNTDVKGKDKTAIENITWPDKSKMVPGQYKFFVNQYSGNARHGFRAEIEFDGEIYSFDYQNAMRTKENVLVAIVTLDKNGNFSIENKLPASASSKTVWGVTTNAFVPVTSVMYSPNHWSTAKNNVGNRHVFFMLRDCVNNENPSGVFNEFLVKELDENKRVMAAISNKLRVESTDDQLSGLGFATTKRNDIVIKVKGATERLIKVTF